MYDSDRGIEEMLHRLGPGFGDGQIDDDDPESDSARAEGPFEAGGDSTPANGGDSDPWDEGSSPDADDPFEGQENPPAASINVEWLADQMRTFVDLNPEWEDAISRFASQLARADDSDG